MSCSFYVKSFKQALSELLDEIVALGLEERRKLHKVVPSVNFKHHLIPEHPICVIDFNSCNQSTHIISRQLIS